MTAPTKPPVWTGFCNVGRHKVCRGVDGHPCPFDDARDHLAAA